MRALSSCCLLCVVFMAMPSRASSQSLPSDPEADSPSGVVYELPVDRARKDAAPRRGSSPQDDDSGSTEGTGTSGQDDTSIRSENNFGTSSSVPGVDAEERNEPRDQGGRSGDKENEAGGAVGSVEGTAQRSAASSGEGPSDAVVFPLLGVLLAVGGVIGVVAGRRRGRS